MGRIIKMAGEIEYPSSFFHEKPHPLLSFENLFTVATS
jgi:hypothetical protein